MPGTINGSDAVRCVYLADNTLLSGFTITGGATSNLIDVLAPQDGSGGGIWCESSNAVVSNCVIIANSCRMFGAGVYGGTVENCQVINNTNQNTSLGGGGGAASATLLGCTIAGNWIQPGNRGGGVISCTLSNCLLTGNSEDGAYSSTLSSCTVSNNFSAHRAGGANNSILNNCLICNNQGGPDGGGAYNSLLNFCTSSNNLTTGFGGGAYYDSTYTNVSGQSNIFVGNVATNFSGTTGGGVYLAASLNLNGWTFVSNSAASDGGGLFLNTASTTLNNCTFIGNSSGGNGGGFCGPSSTLVLASNCTFIGNVAGNGGGAFAALLINCSVIGNRAGNGGGVCGVADNSTLNNNIATTNGGGLYSYYFFPPSFPVAGCAFTNNSALNGGGAYINGSARIGFSNCVFLGNWATNSGGGIDLATLPVDHCTIASNYAGVTGGGVAGDTGGGALSYCIVSGNSAGVTGGGIYDCSIVNGLLSGNSAAYGGGAYYDNPFLGLLGSTIARNQAVNAGGGLYWKPPIRPAGITNCIIYDNFAPTNMNYSPTNTLSLYCCTMPLPSVPSGHNNSNITNDPAFVSLAGGDFHLSLNSPCINSGNNAFVTTAIDLNGNPRVVGGTVDIGSYEYQTPVSQISYAWLQQYGLPINSGTDSADPDADRMNNYQEWIAGTNPTNALSVLEMLSPIPTNNPPGLFLNWQSVNNRTYFLQSSTNLGAQPPFSSIQSNIVGQAGITGYTDTNAVANGPYFYRVGVQ
jgi:hypothetical protein